jgi:N-acyl-D-aspartate/D-glutamate deacylase
VLVDAAGSATFKPFEGATVGAIAAALGRNGGQCFLDILQDSGMEAMFVHPSAGSDVASVCELLNHPYVLAGTSDGGAHSKHGNGGFWSTEMIVRLARESGAISLEALHNLLSARNAEAAGFKDRGVLVPGAFADLFIYDYEHLNRTPELRYEVANDLPGGDWRKVKRALGVRYVAVNGEITFEDGAASGATPGRMVADAGAPTPARRAAAE